MRLLPLFFFFFFKQGTKAVTPVTPVVTRNESIYELQLATITVNKQTNTISQSMIKDTRSDSNVCGWVTGLIQQVDTSTWFEQWDSAYDEMYKQKREEFENWFKKIKEILTTGAAIQELKNKVVTNANWVTSIPIGIPSYVHDFDPINVYINGMRLNSDEYTIDGVNITFQFPLDVIGTEIEVVVYKTFDKTVY